MAFQAPNAVPASKRKSKPNDKDKKGTQWQTKSNHFAYESSYQLLNSRTAADMLCMICNHLTG